MFAKTIVLSDAFLDMPATARCLYFTLGMFADDDGFVSSPKGVIRQCGASEDDLKVLLAKKFLIAFESGVIVIKHWRINNYLRNDRYHTTTYRDELAMLTVDENGAYHSGIPNMGIPRIEKNREDKSREDKSSKGGAGGTRTTTPKKKKTSVDLFNELENGKLSPVFDTVLKWMQYKDESGKPYKTETGMKSFITQVEKHLHEFGAAAVADCIELSMSNNYQGVVWDRLKKQTASNGDSNPFLRMLQESEANDGTGNTEDSIGFEGGIPDVLPGFEGW